MTHYLFHCISLCGLHIHGRLVSLLMRQDVHGYVIHTIRIIIISFTTHVLSQLCQIHCDHYQHFFQNYHDHHNSFSHAGKKITFSDSREMPGRSLAVRTLLSRFQYRDSGGEGRPCFQFFKLSIIQFII